MLFKERAGASERYQSTTALERKKMCSKQFYFVEDCVAASENILFFNERAAASERYQGTTASQNYDHLRNYFEVKTD